MSLRVLDDDRPGYALLAFDGRLTPPRLSISIRSLNSNTYLGPSGQWQRTPHYFDAKRSGEEGGKTQYRVGPEIVNFLLEHEPIEVATSDATVREETLWENAVPQMTASHSDYFIYREPATAPDEHQQPAQASAGPI
jgi:hypothetical protein